MPALGDFFAVAFVVEREQAGEDLAVRGVAHGEPGALPGDVEVMAEIEIVPAVGGGDGVVQLDVQFAQGGDVG